jgi:hypothetical protein
MAIPSRQIGWSQKANLLWQISKQLEILTQVAGNVVIAPQNATYYNVAGCERMEYHVIKYTGAGTLAEGTIVNNATPECWFIVDAATGPEDVGTIEYVWDTPSDCQPCIDSHTTTTTTTTQAGIFAVLSLSSCGSGTATQVQFTTGESLCDAPLAVSGDFSGIPNDTTFYIVYSGISKSFIKTSPTTADYLGGPANECVTCA